MEEKIDWTTKDVVIPSKLKVGDIISYILFNGDDAFLADLLHRLSQHLPDSAVEIDLLRH